MSTIHSPDWARLKWAARHPDETIRTWAASFLGARLNPMSCRVYGDELLQMRDLSVALLGDESQGVLAAALAALRVVPALAPPDPVWATYQRLSGSGRCEPEQTECLSLLAELQDDRILEVVARTGALDLPLLTRFHLLAESGTPAALALLRHQMERAGSDVEGWPHVPKCRNLAGAELFWSWIWDRAQRIGTGHFNRFVDWIDVGLSRLEPLPSGAVELDELPSGVPLVELHGRAAALLAPLRAVSAVIDCCLDPAALRAAGLVLALRPDHLSMLSSALSENTQQIVARLVRLATRRALELAALPAPEAAGPSIRLELLLTGRWATPYGSTRLSAECRSRLLKELWTLPADVTDGLVGRTRAALAQTAPELATQPQLAALLLAAWQVYDPAIIARVWELIPLDRDVARALALMGEVAADRVEEELRSPQPDWARAGAVLIEMDLARGVALWAAHLPEILAHVDWYDAAATLQRLGSPEVLPALELELRPGEPRMYLVYNWLCLLHGVEPVQEPRLPEDSPWRLLYEGPGTLAEGPAVPERSTAGTAGPDGAGAGRPRGGVWVPTRCTAPGCGRNYHYYVRRICFDVDGYRRMSGPDIVDRVRCKGCGAIDSARVTKRGCDELLGVLEGERVPLPQRGRSVVIGPIMLCYREPEAPGVVSRLRALEGLVAAQPQDAAAHLALGNLLWGLAREEQAEEVYRTAVRVDPSAVEAWYVLSQLSARRNDTVTTLRLGETLLRVARPALYDLPRERWEAMRESVSGWVRELRQSGMLRGGRRAGPKDPCPCGSGRRYKSCCLPRDRASYEGQSA